MSFPCNDVLYVLDAERGQLGLPPTDYPRPPTSFKRPNYLGVLLELYWLH